MKKDSDVNIIDNNGDTLKGGYEGEWEDGQPHGVGIWRAKRGKKIIEG